MKKFILLFLFCYLFGSMAWSSAENENLCIYDPKKCSDERVCFWATTKIKDQKVWASSNSWGGHIREANVRGLSCSVTTRVSTDTTKEYEKEIKKLKVLLKNLEDQNAYERRRNTEIRSKYANTIDQLEELRNQFREPTQNKLISFMGYRDDLFLTLYFLIHLFIIFAFFVFLIIERSRSKLLMENDGLDFEGTSYNTVVSSGIGAIPYAIFRFIFRPLILLSLISLIVWSGYLMKWMVMLPALGIILLIISFNSPFLRVLFPIFILGGATDLLLRFL